MYRLYLKHPKDIKTFLKKKKKGKKRPDKGIKILLKEKKKHNVIRIFLTNKSTS